MSAWVCVIISHSSFAPPHTYQNTHTLLPSHPTTQHQKHCYLGRLLGVGQGLVHHHMHILRVPDMDLATVVRARHLCK